MNGFVEKIKEEGEPPIIAPEDATPPAVVALFDFDGTVTHCDSLMPFLRFAVGRARFWAGMIVLTPALLRYCLGGFDRTQFKNSVLSQYFGGWRAEQLVGKVERFNKTVLPALCKDEALARIRWHHEQGHRIVLISASPEIYLSSWAATLPIEAVLATRLEMRDGTFSGRIHGQNCRGPEKVARLTDYLGGLDGYEFFAYGDSAGDREMLAIAAHGYYRPFRRPGACITSRLRFLKALL